MTTSSKGIDLITSFEGLYLYSYDDLTGKRVNKGEPCKGTLTIGYGHTGKDVYKGQTCTKEQAEKWLKQELSQCEKAVSKYQLNQNQFDAMVSFAYNCGIGAMQKVLSSKNPTEHMAKYVNSKGVYLAGLDRRRKAEIKLYNTPVNGKAYYPKCNSSINSIIDALHSIGVNNSFNFRSKIAAANGIKDYKGTADQNITMLKLLKEGKLIKP